MGTGGGSQPRSRRGESGEDRNFSPPGAGEFASQELDLRELRGSLSALQPLVLEPEVVDEIVTELMRISHDLTYNLAQSGLSPQGIVDGSAFLRVDVSRRLISVVSRLMRRMNPPALPAGSGGEVDP